MQPDPLPIIDAAIEMALQNSPPGNDPAERRRHIARVLLEQLDESGFEVTPAIPDKWTNQT